MAFSSRSRLKLLLTSALLASLSVTPLLRAQESATAAADAQAQAIQALKEGKFDKGTSLLERAASVTPDDVRAKRLAEWASQFESQRQVLLEERRKKFDKAVEDVQKLVDAKSYEFAADFAGRAYTLAEDKQRFTDSALIQDIIKRTSTLAADYESNSQWIKAQRLYSDLSVLEPLNSGWSDKLKATTRRIRVLALYTPDVLKQLREEESKLVDELDKIIPPTTPRPATRPVSADAESAFRIDWRETLRSIRPEMLWSSLINVRSNYWRDVSFTAMMKSGLEGVRAVVATQGLDAAFPSLGDKAKRDAFLAKIDEFERQLAATKADSEVLVSNQIYRKLLEFNRSTLKLPEEVIVYEFADGAFAVCDPFTSMIWPSDVDEFNKSTQGEFSGVGIQIQNDDEGNLKVVSPLEDSPAYEAGIKASDIITHVNGKSVKGVSTTKAVQIITGPQGTPVTLTVKSLDGTVKDYTLVRKTINNASLKGYSRKPGGGWDYFIDPDNKIAYLRLTQFTKRSGEELEKATAELKEQGARGLIFDLRYNPGGLLSAAIDVSNRFLSQGVIVSTRADRPTPQAPTVTNARPDPDEVTIPMVVLVNQFSASASEIVSGALKDQGRAIVVGERSFGKGSVQMLFQVGGGDAYLKLTTSHYYLPSGRCLHREDNSAVWGVDPDVKVEMTPEQMINAQRARSDLDILRAVGEAIPTSLPTTQPSEGEATTRPIVRTTEDLLKIDNQLGAALLLLRLQLNGIEVANGTPAPGVKQDSR